MSKIQWADPPPEQTGKRGIIHELLPELKMHPGQWALVEKKTRRSRLTAWKRAGCEAVSRGERGSDVADIYARWPETVERIGQCAKCGRSVKVNEQGLCRMHRPVEGVA